MPYIVQHERLALHSEVNRLVEKLYDHPGPGNYNYVITRILNEGYDLTTRPSYAKLNEALGILEAVKLELYRRVAAPYEDQKKEQNGDVY